ncbi:hypothetical protein M8J77_022477 [Diaphorina citri]|nr:hypothetical protein M8J77_022477 [Diaphorina citri]
MEYSNEELHFRKSQHARYFKLHLDMLPEKCSSYDSIRVTLLFFAISGLDVLNCLDNVISADRRKDIIDWIYKLQVVPNESSSNLEACGFQGSNCLNFSDEFPSNMCSYRLGNIALTYSALCTLIILGDDLSRVHKKAVLHGVKVLQEKSGRSEMSTIGAGVATVSSLTVTTLLVSALVLWFVYYRITRRRLYELAGKIPGPKGLPLVGEALELLGKTPCNIFDHMKKVANDFADEPVIKIWLGPRLIVFLKDPRDIEIILSSTVYIDKSPEYKFYKPWLGNGLLISTGEKWRTHRKLIAPTFHLNVLKSFLDLFNQSSRAVVEKMRKHKGEEFDCHDYMSECTVEILLQTAMGVDKKTQNQSGLEYAMAVMKMCYILHIRSSKVWLRPDYFFHLTSYAKDQVKQLDIIHTLTKQVLKKKKETYEKNKSDIPNRELIKEENKPEVKEKTVVEELSFGQSYELKDDLDVEDVGEKKRLAFLDLLIESAQNGVVLTDEEIKEQVDTIMFEGHDTTAAGSSFFLCVMGTHPEIQAKVMQELDEIFGDSDRLCTFQDTLEMKYMERCIMETFRMFPPVPLIARELQQEVKLNSCDRILPAKCTIVIATFQAHRQSDIYPNPDVYNPDNFLLEKCANRHYYSFIPFSAGPRSCVGRKYAMLKLKVILSTILRNFTVYSPIKFEDWKVQADIILKRTDGFKIQLKPRRKQLVD